MPQINPNLYHGMQASDMWHDLVNSTLDEDDLTSIAYFALSLLQEKS